MLTDSSTQLSLAELFDALPDNVIYYRAVRNETGSYIEKPNPVVDFVIGYINPAALRAIADHYPVSLNSSLRNGSAQDPAFIEQRFTDLCEVLESGKVREMEYFNPKFGQWFSLRFSKAGDGVLSIAGQNNTSTHVQQEKLQQQRVFERTINASLNGIVTYESIRNQAGTIVDFRATTVNEVAQHILHLPDTKPGWLLLEQFPGVQERGMFDQYIDVIETGESLRFETPFSNEKFSGWYDVAVVKLGDGFVITFNDITTGKRAQQEIEHQANLMQNMLTGIMLLQPIRQDDGSVFDYRILTANRAAADLTNTNIDTVVGHTMLEVFPTYKESGFFDIYTNVLETGQPGRLESKYEDDKLNEWFEVLVVKQNDNVVLTYTRTTETWQAKEALSRAIQELQSVIDYSQTGIFVFSPVYDESGQHVDFRFKTINRMVAALIGQTPDAIRGDLASNWFISYRDTETFTRYKTTLSTGEEQRFDTNYNVDGLDVWFDVHAVKLGDDVLVTFTDFTDLKRVQLAQEQQAKLLNSVLNGTNNGIMAFEAVRDRQGAIVDLLITSTNSVGAGIAGKTIDELVGKRSLTDFPGIKSAGLYDLYVHTIQTGEPAQMELHYQADGLDVFVDVKTSQLGDGLVVTYNDVTAARQMSLQIEQTASLLNNVLDGSKNGIMSFKAIRDEAGIIQDFQFLTINATSARMVGKTAEEIIGKTMLSVFPGNVESGLFAKYVYTTNTSEPTQTEVYYKADGLDFWLDISARKLGDGFVVTFTDTSLIKRASLVLEQSAAELQTVIDTAQTGIFLIDPIHDKQGRLVDFQFRVANKTLAAYVGQDSTAAAGVLASVWFPGYQTNGLFERYKHTHETGEQQRFDFHYESDGIDSWLDIMATKVNDEVLVTFSDYTPLKKLQQQLEASIIDLERSNKNLEQFAYVASHDLQEPLRKIQQFSDILQTNYAEKLDEAGQGMLTRMQLAADRMRILIRDVLAYSRITTKRENAQLLDLNTIVGEVLTDLETVITDKQAITYVGSLSPITGDAVQIRQLFQNLISNALKFNKLGRQPELRLTGHTQRGQETGLIISPADATKLFYRIELSDNGIGFDPTHAGKIFQVFQRLHSRNEYAGTGIGLAIVQKVVENHQGYIQAEGRPGEGATFVILLPV